jgi:tripartite-type tricarboxylate transporter receptor subunit TctC
MRCRIWHIVPPTYLPPREGDTRFRGNDEDGFAHEPKSAGNRDLRDCLTKFIPIPALALAAAATPALAQNAANYPNRPIRLIVPFAPGGGLDISARLIGHKLTEKWGQNVVVDSRPGAATIVGTEIASKAAPDGYTVLMITTTFAINPGLYARLPYDAGKDFAPVTQLNSQPNVVVVTPSFAGKSVKDLIALAKAKPGELTYATPGAGSAPHLSAEMFQRAAGVTMIHVPYKGIPAAVTDVIGGRVTMLFTTTISAAPHVNSGKLRAIAITSARRQPSMPDVPTVGETLPGYRAEAFQGPIVVGVRCAHRQPTISAASRRCSTVSAASVHR